MRVIRARFQTTVRVGSKEFNFIDGQKERIEMNVEAPFLVATKGTARTLIPFANIAYIEQAPEIEEQSAPVKATRK
jgi:hypothetical protein